MMIPSGAITTPGYGRWTSFSKPVHKAVQDVAKEKRRRGRLPFAAKSDARILISEQILTDEKSVIVSGNS